MCARLLRISCIPLLRTATYHTINRKHMKSFQFIEHEFEGVAHFPVWLEVGRFMAEDDLKRLCQWIPELHGIDRMVDAKRDSKHMLRIVQTLVG